MLRMSNKIQISSHWRTYIEILSETTASRGLPLATYEAQVELRISIREEPTAFCILLPYKPHHLQLNINRCKSVKGIKPVADALVRTKLNSLDCGNCTSSFMIISQDYVLVWYCSLKFCILTSAMLPYFMSLYTRYFQPFYIKIY